MAKTSTKRINFTRAALDKLRAPKTGRVYVYDVAQPALTICVTSAGTKTFYIYRWINGRPARIRLARWPELSISDARTRAAEVVVEVANGGDPITAKRRRREVQTFSELFNEFNAAPTRTRTKRPKSARTKQAYQQLFDAYLKGWAGTRIDTLDRNDVQAMHTRVGKDNGLYIANRALAMIRAMFNYAIEQGALVVNPTSGVRHFSEVSREVIVTHEEMPRLLAALEAKATRNVRDLVLLLLLTGSRRGALQKARWKDIDLEIGIWTTVVKGGHTQVIPLPPEAVLILRQRRELRGMAESEWVFPSKRGAAVGPMRDPLRIWADVKAAAGLPNLRMHDLRRTFGSWLAMSGASLELIGKALGHRDPSVTKIYARWTLNAVRQGASGVADAIMAMRPNPTKPADDEEGRTA